MNKSLALLAAALGVAFAAPSFAETKVEAKSSETVKTDAGKASTETKTTAKTDDAGVTTKETKTTDVNDPKGLLNKEKTKTVSKTKTDAAGNVIEAETKVDGKEVSPSAGKPSH